ncbi:MAG: hypothetical protein PWP15_1125 [Methanothermococcus sp.]|uniref:hypothetical protein n=1 Tax=Methanothermococcus sp. TaxID=2614238 RepID=UPI0025838766|nr:hypothetical protein [Methanothermococcus sp.]MDK2790618.1 hypothetical protein [Methanothermococcus sp.]
MKKRLGSYLTSNLFIEIKKIEKGIVTYGYIGGKGANTAPDVEHTATLHPEGLYFYDKEYHRKHFLREFY